MKNVFILFTGLLMLTISGCGSLVPMDPPGGQTAEPNSPPADQAAVEAEASSPAPTPTPALISAETARIAIEDTLEASTSGSGETPPVAAAEFGTADLAIIRPGQFSRHRSPIRLVVNLIPGEDRAVEITLYGEDGRVLFNETGYAHPFDDPINGNLIKDIEFSIETMAETGRLEFKVYDSYGRLKALNSVYLILLSDGITDRNYSPENKDRVLLQLPFPDQLDIHTSPLFIAGLVRTTSDTPLSVWLVDQEGEILGKGEAPVVLSAGSPVGNFVGEIPYQVAAPTPALLTFGLEEGRIPGFTYVKTIEVMLYPAGT
ncbi:MAG: hypothetical protein PVI99_04860 [Anaerolineales bacterium]